jgi:hypothetical protein
MEPARHGTSPKISVRDLAGQCLFLWWKRLYRTLGAGAEFADAVFQIAGPIPQRVFLEAMKLAGAAEKVNKISAQVEKSEFELESFHTMQGFCSFEELNSKEGLYNGRILTRGDIAFLVPPLVFRHYTSKVAGTYAKIICSGIKVNQLGTLVVNSCYDEEETEYTTKLQHFYLMALLNIEKMAALDLKHIREATIIKVRAEIARLEEPDMRHARRTRILEAIAKDAEDRRLETEVLALQQAKRSLRARTQQAARQIFDAVQAEQVGIQGTEAGSDDVGHSSGGVRFSFPDQSSLSMLFRKHWHSHMGLRVRQKGAGLNCLVPIASLPQVLD